MEFYGYRVKSLRFYIRGGRVIFYPFQLGNIKHGNPIEDDDQDLNLPATYLIAPPLSFSFEYVGYCGDAPSARDSASRSAFRKAYGVLVHPSIIFSQGILPKYRGVEIHWLRGGCATDDDYPRRKGFRILQGC